MTSLRLFLLAVFVAFSSTIFAAEPDLAPIKAEIAKRHDESIKRLHDWIAQISIAAENRGYPQGAEYMAQLARDAGFQNVRLVPSAGKPGVFGTIDAGAKTTLGIYFMSDARQYDTAERS